jgi:hypothetical protein
MREYALWLHSLAAQGGKGIVNNIDARALGRIADALDGLNAWRECALYDALMSGPVFKGWDRSALDRCRRQYEAARKLAK